MRREELCPKWHRRLVARSQISVCFVPKPVFQSQCSVFPTILSLNQKIAWFHFSLHPSARCPLSHVGMGMPRKGQKGFLALFTLLSSPFPPLSLFPPALHPLDLGLSLSSTKRNFPSEAQSNSLATACRHWEIGLFLQGQNVWAECQWI